MTYKYLKEENTLKNIFIQGKSRENVKIYNTKMKDCQGKKNSHPFKKAGSESDPISFA